MCRTALAASASRRDQSRIASSIAAARFARGPELGSASVCLSRSSGVGGAALDARRDPVARALAPFLQHGRVQRGAIREVPVEAAAGDAQTLGQRIDAHGVDAAFGEHVERRLDPGGGVERVSLV